jgi:hypothetical protein
LLTISGSRAHLWLDSHPSRSPRSRSSARRSHPIQHLHQNLSQPRTHSHIFQISKAIPSITINIKSLHRSAYSLGAAFYPFHTIWHVKEVVQQAEEIPCNKQSLYFKEVPLEDG